MVDVLLVDDEKWVRTALRKVMEQSAVPIQVVHEAADGKAASEWLRTHRTDLVMTDIRMPVMDGISLLCEIKRCGYKCDVVIVSGHDDFAYARQALRYGAIDYLLKPVESEHIEACIEHWQQIRLEQQAAKDSVHPTGEQSAVQQVIHYIKANLAYDLTSREAAELVHLNPSYFSKLFRNKLGMTFTDYMMKLRMEEAKRLLEGTSLRVNEIAERLGFTDTAYFSNTFKKACSQTPSEYRRRNIRII